jgi:anthranilate synthase component I
MSDRAAERRAFASKAVAGARVPVARILPSDLLTPVLLFQRLRAPGAESFLLESVEGGENVARYTFLGVNPSARLTVRDGRTCLERGGVAETLGGAPLAILDRLVRSSPFVADPDLPPLAAGAVGYLSYDAVRLFEAIPNRHPRLGGLPDALFALYDAVIAFDHPRQRLLLLTTIEATEGRSSAAAADEAISRLDALENLVMARAGTSPAPTTPDTVWAVLAAARFEPLMEKAEFLAAVGKIKEAIAAGDVYQTVVSQRWTARLGLDPFDVYRSLRALNPSPYLFYLETREATLLGSSPEMLVRCRGREVETRPIAGTAPRGKTAGEDAALAHALSADPKERAEHVMLVDLARNDLGRVCEIGSVRVARYAEVEKFSHVQHLVSEVRGVLSEGRGCADAVEACFPAGTLTGAPKIRAMELIDALEATRRGAYGGAVGYFDAAGNCDLAIAIRTAVVEDGVCRVQAGAGIVADSVPEKEYAEAESKARALFAAVDLAREWFGGWYPKSKIENPKSQ